MTDNEIIKALECCVKDEWYCDNNCLFFKNCSKTLMAKNALDLIKHQKEEIEQWKEEANRYQNLWCMAVDDIGTAKSEAIKEFAEKLEYFVLNEDIEIVKPKCKYYGSYINGANQFRHQIKNGINNLVKEMTEIATNQRKEDEGK